MVNKQFTSRSEKSCAHGNWKWSMASFLLWISNSSYEFAGLSIVSGQCLFLLFVLMDYFEISVLNIK